MMENNKVFIKSIYQNIWAEKKKDIIKCFVLQETKNSNLFICQKRYSRQRQMSYSTRRMLT